MEEHVIVEENEESDSVSQSSSEESVEEDRASFANRIRNQIVRSSTQEIIPEEYHHLFDAGDDKADFKAQRSIRKQKSIVRTTTTITQAKSKKKKEKNKRRGSAQGIQEST